MTLIMYIVKRDLRILLRGSFSVRVTREQAAANRGRIVDVAGTLFRQHGFNGIGVADIMKAAGLTHGGFYGHFPSKEELAAEACAAVLMEPAWAERLAGSPHPTLKAVVRKYLTPRHRNDPAHGCLLAALGSDVARQPRSVRRAFTEGVKARVDALRALLPGRSDAARRKKAVATLAGIVGALILSRAVDDPTLSEEILDAATATFGHV
jgi:TetR/AcrR family transcriptional repressor of nem operon